MDTELKTLRIFISSPGDVHEERQQAEQVVHEIDSQLGAQANIEVILWEHLGIGADASFQEGINRLLERGGGIDIAVFILWSRIGSEVGGKLVRENGTRWASGTQAELYLMLEAREQSSYDPKRPEILVYVREDEDGFRKRIVSSPSDQMESLLKQKRDVEAFIRTEFKDEEGRNLRAYHGYPEPVTFANQLEVHLRSILNRLLGENVAGSHWTTDPYRGLGAFDIEHADIFRGRELQVLELEELFRDRHRRFLEGSDESLPFVVILGTSGSGKSSLARAGLAAKLHFRNRDPTIRQWRVSTFIPGTSGKGLMGALSQAIREPDFGLAELNAPSSAIVAEHLMDSPSKLAEAGLDLASQAAGGDTRLLLVIDQMEELFAPGVEAAERRQLLEELEALSRTGKAWILGTLRSDFYATAQQEEIFRRLKSGNGGYDLVPPKLEDMRRMIVEPAQLAGLHFETESRTGRSLADVILEEAAEGGMLGLPLLQDALQELYQRRDNEGRFTFDSYNKMGGIRGALGKRTTRLVESLPDDQSEELGSLFRHLVTIETDSGRVVRQRVRKEALASPPSLAALVASLSGTEARILNAGGDDNNATISLAHEALISAWPQLGNWVESNRKGLLDRAETDRSRLRWEKEGRPNSLLLPKGPLLTAARNLKENFPHLLDDNSETLEYIRRSSQHHQRRTLLFRAAVVATVIGGMGFLFYAQHQAELEKRLQSEKSAALERLGSEVLSNRLLALLQRNQPEQALALAATDPAASFGSFGTRSATVKALGAVSPHLVSIATVPDEDRFDAREQSLARGVTSIDSNPYDRTIALGTRGGTVLHWEPETREMHAFFSPEGADGLGTSVKSIHHLKDGAIASVHEDGRIGIGEFGASAPPRFEKLANDISHACISGDGSALLTARSEDISIRVPDIRQSGNSTKSDLSGRATAVGVANGGWSIVAANGPDNHATLTCTSPSGNWNHTSESPVVSSIAIHDQQDIFAMGTLNSGVELQTRTSGTVLGRLPFDYPITALDWHPELTWLAATTGAGELLLWKLEKRVDNFGGTDFSQLEPTLRISAHLETALSVAWSRDGNRLVTGADDGTLKLWIVDPPDLAFRRFSVEFESGFRGVDVSHDGKLLAGGTENSGVRVWSLERRALAAEPVFRSGPEIQSLAWHPAERLLASGNGQGHVRFTDWTSDTPRILNPGGEQHTDTVWKLRWSPDGNSLFSSSWDHQIGLWSKKGELVKFFKGHDDYVQGLAVSPDGATVASGATNGEIWLWNVADGSMRKKFEGHAPGPRVAVCALDFSPDGKLLASASNDGRVILWDAASGERVRVFPGHEGDVEAVAFSPDGSLIASAGDDGRVWVWQRDAPEPLFVYSAHEKSISNLVWIPGDSKTIVTASADGTIHFLPCSLDWWKTRLQTFADITVDDN